MTKRAVALLLFSVVLVAVLAIPCAAQNVLPPGSPDANVSSSPLFGPPLGEAINKLIRCGALSGYPDRMLHPYDPVTRAQFVKMLVITLRGEVSTSADPKGVEFTDVPAWAAPYVKAATAWGWVEGIAPDRFGPNEPVTGAQLATVLIRALGKADQVPLTVPWYAGYVAAAREAGLLWENFNPEAPVTRARCILTLAKLIIK